MRLCRTAAIAALLFSLPMGCASVIQGKTESVKIHSEPQGSTVVVDGTNYTTPAVVTLGRDADHYVVFPNGERIEITRKLSAAFFGNILLGGVIGMAVDGVSGAASGNLEPDFLIYRAGKVYDGESKKELRQGAQEKETEPAPSAAEGGSDSSRPKYPWEG